MYNSSLVVRRAAESETSTGFTISLPARARHQCHPAAVTEAISSELGQPIAGINSAANRASTRLNGEEYSSS